MDDFGSENGSMSTAINGHHSFGFVQGGSGILGLNKVNTVRGRRSRARAGAVPVKAGYRLRLRPEAPYF